MRRFGIPWTMPLVPVRHTQEALRAYTFTQNRRFRVAQKLLWTSSSLFLGDPIIPEIRGATRPLSPGNPMKALPVLTPLSAGRKLQNEASALGWLRNETKTNVGREHER
jgi:hypothetical protein